MRMKLIAGCGFLLNTIFFATYYSVTKEALNRIDPIIFTFFEMVSLAPAGLLIILFSWKDINRAVVKRGILLGSTLCLALFTIAIALKYTTATSTAFFPALNGFVAALIAWLFFREPMNGRTWLAGVLSVGGAALLIFSSSMGNFRGTLIAFLGGLFYTAYIFLSDHEQKNEKAHWPLFGVELLTTAVWANLIALLFGDWQTVHPALPKDVLVILYVAFACTFVSTLITVLLQKHISPVTVSFIYILEPVLGAFIANLYLGEVLPVQGYLGGGLVVLGAIISIWGSMKQSGRKPASKQVNRRETRSARGSWVSALLYPGLGCVLGALLLTRLGGMPPAAWSEFYQIWPQIPLAFQQGQSAAMTLLLVQAGSWLVAWISVALMGCLVLSNLIHLASRPAQPRPQAQRRAEQPTRATRQMQPARQAHTTALLPEQQRFHTATLAPEQSRVHPAARPPEQRPRQPRVTTRLPEPPMPQPQAPRKPRVTTRLPEPPAPQVRPVEHPTWYGNTVWNRVAVVGLGPDTPPPVTEPLPIDQIQTQEYLYMERLDA
jgi:drug/metabolite transporter (DMT)-like permease